MWSILYPEYEERMKYISEGVILWMTNPHCELELLPKE